MKIITHGERSSSTTGNCTFSEAVDSLSEDFRSQLSELKSQADSLPCLYSNISIENTSTQLRKSASALAWNVNHFSQKFGIENLGFLTLTFAQHITSPKEAQRRLNSLISNVLKPRYGDYVGVMERQKSGRIHYHLLVNVRSDIRTGVDFNGLSKRDYSSAPDSLRSEWSFWRSTAKKYGFGRTELLPVMSNSEAIGRYVGKYIGKHISNRLSIDKNARLVRYSKGARVVTTRFQFLSEGSEKWREKVKQFAYYIAEREGLEPSFDMLSSVLGPRWAYNHREFILSMPG